MISGILPRAQNDFPGKQLSDGFLERFNRIASEVNDRLRHFANIYSQLWYTDHPEFVVDELINRQLLSRDGLHLSFRGTEDVFRTICRTISFIEKRKIITETALEDTFTTSTLRTFTRRNASRCVGC